MHPNPRRLITVGVRKFMKSAAKLQILPFFGRDDSNCASDEEIAADFDDTYFQGASFNFSSSF